MVLPKGRARPSPGGMSAVPGSWPLLSTDPISRQGWPPLTFGDRWDRTCQRRNEIDERSHVAPEKRLNLRIVLFGHGSPFPVVRALLEHQVQTVVLKRPRSVARRASNLCPVSIDTVGYRARLPPWNRPPSATQESHSTFGRFQDSRMVSANVAALTGDTDPRLRGRGCLARSMYLV